MNEKIVLKKDKPEELIRAKQLIEECKYDEADQLIKNFEEKGGHTLHDKVLCHLLKCELLFWRFLYEDVVKLAEETYKESLGLGKNLLSVDILLIMAHALLCLYQTDKSHDITKQGEELLKTLTLELPAEYKQREAYIAFLKGWAYEQKTEADPAIKQFELSISLRKELDTKKEIAYSVVGLADVFMFLKGDFDRALIYLKQGLALAEESGNKWMIGYCIYYMAQYHSLKGELDHSIMLDKRSLTIYNDLNSKFMVVRVLNSLGSIYAMKGEVNHSIKYYEQSLELSKEYNFKSFMTFALNGLSESYRMKGDLERALECIEQSMGLNRELGNSRILAFGYDSLIQILIEIGNLERARISLRDLELLNSQLKDKFINLCYLFDKALLLKTSPRARNRVKAEELLKQILEEEDLSINFLIYVLLNICELLLAELQISNDVEILEEIKPYITQLLDLSDKSHSFLILCETYMLQAKLSLLTFDIKKAQRFLTQAQQIAQRFGLNMLAKKIVIENEVLLKKSDLWEKLKESGAPMADRLELARLDEKIVELVYNRAVLTPYATEEKVVISKETKICLVCRGEVIGFSYNCKCGANYCDNCARALTNLENVCWACDAQIDYSKPVKPFKEEERVKVEEKAEKEVK